MTERQVWNGCELDSDLDLEADVIIIGTGAGGGISAEVLSSAGLNLVMVEEGTHHKTAEVPMRESWSFSRLYREGGANPTKDGALTVVQGRAVGGSTLVNWTSAFRAPEQTLAHWRTHHGIEGIGLDEMTEWYELIEHRLNIAPWQDHNANNLLLSAGAEKLGWKWAPIARNVKDCVGHGFCGLGCPVDAKQGMDQTTIPSALKHGARLVTRVRAERFVWKDDRVTGVEASPRRARRPADR